MNAPLRGECNLHFECKIVGKQILMKEVLLPDIDAAWYSDENYYTLYHEEIVSTYTK